MDVAVWSARVLFLLVLLARGQCERMLQSMGLESLASVSDRGQQIFYLLNWQSNDRLIQRINSNSAGTFQAGHNRFSYLSLAEIDEIYLGLNVEPLREMKVAVGQTQTSFGGIQYASLQQGTQNLYPQMPVYAALPSKKLNIVTASIDWRGTLASPIRDQGKCGACWAFSTVADLESHFRLKYPFSMDLSEQQLIDCSGQEGNVGCTGGMMDNAFRYVLKQGITLQTLYPYANAAQPCRMKKTMPAFSITGSKIIYGDCGALREVLSWRPVSVVISASPSFIFYKTGILNSCGTVMNHALQLVGLVNDGEGSYYVGKNSWGRGWGRDGYVYIDSLLNDGNLCNVCSYPQYPV